jgi:hypothetical protein
MTEPPKDLVLEQLRLLRGDFERIECKFDDMSHTVGAMAQTMVSVRRDVRRLTDTIAPSQKASKFRGATF